MTREEFCQAALSLLARNGEMDSVTLHDCINEEFKTDLNPGRFYNWMDYLVETDCVTKRHGLAFTPERHAARGGHQLCYFSITDGGHRKRTELLEKDRQEKSRSIPGAAPEPA